MKHDGNLAQADQTLDSSTLQSGTFVQYGEDWTIGYGTTSFLLRNALGLTYIQRLLEHPGASERLPAPSTGAPANSRSRYILANFG